MKFRSTGLLIASTHQLSPITPPVEIDTALSEPNHPAIKITLAPALENRAM
jgi:hypothetical protein